MSAGIPGMPDDASLNATREMSAMYGSLRANLIAEGYSPEVADSLVQNTVAQSVLTAQQELIKMQIRLAELMRSGR